MRKTTQPSAPLAPPTTHPGTPGNDVLTGTAGADVFDGGAGNDTLEGRGGSDIYKFGRTSGNDLIRENADYKPNVDSVLFEPGIAAGDVSVTRNSVGDLLLTLSESGNVLRIDSYFYKDGASAMSFEQIRFSDGTMWDLDYVKARALQGTAGNDKLYGYATPDVMDGGGGDDWVNGKGGSDTYKFGHQSGNDTLREDSDFAPNTDVVLFDPGIAPHELSLARGGTGDELYVQLAGSGATLTLTSYFFKDAMSPSAFEQFRFADGTVWDVAFVKARLLEGTAGNDKLWGYATDDVLDGGAGSDWMNGKEGSDTYKWDPLGGNDTIREYFDYKPNTDTVLLAMQPADVMVTRASTGDDLFLRHRETLHVLRIDGYFYRNGASDMAMEQIAFSDGTVWRYAEVEAMTGGRRALSPEPDWVREAQLTGIADPGMVPFA